MISDDKMLLRPSLFSIKSIYRNIGKPMKWLTILITLSILTGCGSGGDNSSSNSQPQSQTGYFDGSNNYDGSINYS